MRRGLFYPHRRRWALSPLAGLGLLGFAALALGFGHPPVSVLDAELGQTLFGWRDGWLAQGFGQFAQVSNWLGHAPIQTLWVLWLAGLMATLGRDRPAAGVLVASMLGQWGVNQLVKTLIDRPRPQLDPLLHTVGASFPSGHAMSATVLYGFIALWLLPRLRPAQQPWLLALAMLWIAAHALARPYLGAHYVSDVLAGVALGLVCLSPARHWLQGQTRAAYL